MTTRLPAAVRRPVSRRHALKSVASGFGYLAFAGLAHEAAAKEPPAAPARRQGRRTSPRGPSGSSSCA